MTDKWIAWFDGACPRGVPHCGVLIRDALSGTDLFRSTAKVTLLSEEQTTNVAEYGGLVHALELAELNMKNGDILEVRGDSQLVVRQMSGEYRLKREHLRPYARRAGELIEALRARGISVVINWVPREENREADALSKEKLE